ncbi:hypothetical protein GF339_20745 [candidate division KSB3 bacterium]|uniref:Uncharacterized protein n=1 Tax=candidate division KSB3 bacterium TaxID=2044937 RepID=A0A9D5Q870_9BACT|nr:hypothetical protein [candidate division KSB3 bacterium]MBD3327027.1 hypothetical protein [candidate division KSB3 bacterium]
MAISGNPRMMAHDIARGLTNVTPASLKKYTPQDLKVLVNNLQIVLREIRGKQTPQGDLMALKQRNQHLQHINQAITIITNYAKKRKIQL